MLPLLSLMDSRLTARLAGEACAKGGGAGKRRRASIYFRGAHGTTQQAQQLRARLWEVRSHASHTHCTAALAHTHTAPLPQRASAPEIPYAAALPALRCTHDQSLRCVFY